MNVQILSKLKGGLMTAGDPLLRLKVNATWRQSRQRAKPHHLERRLFISLTSYPPRYGTLQYTIQSLLSQTVKPDGVVLWIAKEQAAELPPEVLSLVESGLIIRECENARSYKKFVHAFAELSDAYIVIADDDTFYWPTWLAELIADISKGNTDILCYRAHKITLDDGIPASYDRWIHNTKDKEPSPFIVPTGLGGVVYQPWLFTAEVKNIESALELAPTADDLWLYAMARKSGLMARKVGRRVRFHNWNGSQNHSLYAINSQHMKNDRQLAALIDRYGTLW